MELPGLKFGFSHDLLQLNYEDVILSDAVLDRIADRARLLAVVGPLPVGEQFGDNVVGEALADLLDAIPEPVDKEIESFLKDVVLALFDTLVPIGERAGIGRRKGKGFFLTETFIGEFSERAFMVEVSERSDVRFQFFSALRDAVAARLARNDPSSIKYADVFALFLMNLWLHDGSLKHLEDLVYPP